MSNVIKSGFVRFDDCEKKIINPFEETKKDENIKNNQEQQIESGPAPVVTRDLNTVLKEKEKTLKKRKKSCESRRKSFP